MSMSLLNLFVPAVCLFPVFWRHGSTYWPILKLQVVNVGRYSPSLNGNTREALIIDWYWPLAQSVQRGTFGWTYLLAPLWFVISGQRSEAVWRKKERKKEGKEGRGGTVIQSIHHMTPLIQLCGGEKKMIRFFHLLFAECACSPAASRSSAFSSFYRPLACSL